MFAVGTAIRRVRREKAMDYFRQIEPAFMAACQSDIVARYEFEECVTVVQGVLNRSFAVKAPQFASGDAELLLCSGALQQTTVFH